jgi:hypothetical protein
MRNAHFTRERIERLPGQLRDGILLDAVDYMITKRERPAGEEFASHYANILPEIPKRSPLADKILAFHDLMSREYEWGRSPEGKKQIEANYSLYPGHHDPDEWARWRYEQIARFGQGANLTDDERETLISAILNYFDEEESEEYSRLRINFHRFHGPGWFARYRNIGDDKDAPEYLDDALPYFDESLTRCPQPLQSRNYTLFAALADVRNDGGVEPIAEPRGIPDDVGDDFRKLADYWGVDGHSHSYHTLADLYEYDLDGDVTYTGLISETSYLRLKEEGYGVDPYVGPDSWAGGIGGQGIVTFTEAGYERWVEIGRPFIRQPQSVSFLAPDIHVSPEFLPNKSVPAEVAALQAAPIFQDKHHATTIEEATAGTVDLWAELDPEVRKMMESRQRDYDTQRYTYNGVKPFIEVTWKQKRRTQMGREFHAMVTKFEEIIAERGLTPEQIRVIFCFDN